MLRREATWASRALFGAYWRLPRPCRVAVARAVEPASGWVRRQVRLGSRAAPPAFRIEADGGLRALWRGSRVGAHYLARLLGAAHAVPQPARRRPLWQAARGGEDADVIAVEAEGPVEALLRRQGFAILPQWVQLHLDVNRPVEEYLAARRCSSLDSDLRAIRQQGYRWEAAAGADAFDAFYAEMYVPYARGRFGGSTMLQGYQAARRLFDRGVLLHILAGRDVVGGLLLEKRGRTAILWTLGVACRPTPERCVTAAAYRAVLEWANANGCDRLDLGHCRPFLSDGVLGFKRKWGARLGLSTRQKGVLALKVCRRSPAALAFLAAHPMIGREGDRLAAWLFSADPDPLTAEAVRSLGRCASIEGLNGIRVFSPAGLAPGAAEEASARLGLRLPPKIVRDFSCALCYTMAHAYHKHDSGTVGERRRRGAGQGMAEREPRTIAAGVGTICVRGA